MRAHLLIYLTLCGLGRIGFRLWASLGQPANVAWGCQLDIFMFLPYLRGGGVWKNDTAVDWTKLPLAPLVFPALLINLSARFRSRA